MPYIRVKGDRRYLVTHPHPIMWMGQFGIRYKLIVPTGFVLDAGSIPWFARPIIPGDWTLGVIPTLFHDFVYYREGRFLPHEYQMFVYKDGVGSWVDAQEQEDGSRTTMTRYECDFIWRDMMTTDSVNRIRVNIAYYAVRAAVWKSWPEGTWNYKQ